MLTTIWKTAQETLYAWTHSIFFPSVFILFFLILSIHRWIFFRVFAHLQARLFESNLSIWHHTQHCSMLNMQYIYDDFVYTM